MSSIMTLIPTNTKSDNNKNNDESIIFTMTINFPFTNVTVMILSMSFGYIGKKNYCNLGVICHIMSLSSKRKKRKHLTTFLITYSLLYLTP